MTRPLPYLSPFCTQAGVKRSFWRLHTQVRLSYLWRGKRDSSLNQILLFLKSRLSMYDTNVHVCLPGSKLGHYKVFLTEFRVDETCYGLSRRKFSVDLGYIPAAVIVAVPGRWRRWNTRIYLSWAGVVKCGLPLLLRSWADPVWLNLS